MLGRRHVVALLAAPVVALGLFPELVGLDTTTPLTQLAAFRPQATVALLLVAVLLAVRRSWRWTAAAIALPAMVGTVLAAPRGLSEPDEVPASAVELTVMAANVLGGGADVDALAALIRDRRPAFVALPEAEADVRGRIEAELAGLGYRGHTQQTDAGVPVSATSVLVAPELGDVRVEPGPAGTEFGSIVVSGGTLGDLRLVAYHSYPPVPGAVGRWRHDLRALRGWCSGTAPTVVAGDLNATLDHAELRSALGRCRTVSAEVGGGFQGTWPAGRPAVLRTQIDHVVVPPGIVPTGFTTYDVPGSDHRAVVATVAVPA